ncbi:hypothetical protein AB4Z09_13605 [Rhodococcus sp. TAF43]
MSKPSIGVSSAAARKASAVKTLRAPAAASEPANSPAGWDDPYQAGTMTG